MSAANGESRFVVNNGVRLHYHIRGAGPPIVLLHGYPEYWDVWRHQFADLGQDHLLIAPDLRGFNLSDRPQGVENYSAEAVAGDLLAILAGLELHQASFVGHDIGGMIAWWIASYAPQHVARLAIISAPHPVEYLRARRWPLQRNASRYLDRMLASGRAEPLRPEELTFWLDDDRERAELASALRLSDADAVASYYKANLSDHSPFQNADMPRVGCRTLVLYGSDDPYIVPQAYAETRRWVDGPLTVRELNGKGHFLHHSAVAVVNAELRRWLSSPS